MARPWTAHEDTILERLFATTDNETIGKMIDRTPDAVRTRAHRWLELKKSPEYNAQIATRRRLRLAKPAAKWTVRRHIMEG